MRTWRKTPVKIKGEVHELQDVKLVYEDTTINYWQLMWWSSKKVSIFKEKKLKIWVHSSFNPWLVLVNVMEILFGLLLMQCSFKTVKAKKV